MRRATFGVPLMALLDEFQSTLSMRRATVLPKVAAVQPNISIHALHEESDVDAARDRRLEQVISIHALHEESDLDHTALPVLVQVFQSTLSMRRATHQPRASGRTVYISIHALHEESDCPSAMIVPFCSLFQSTLSMRRATPDGCSYACCPAFQSTLSMRRATRLLLQSPPIHPHFNPRSP